MSYGRMHVLIIFIEGYIQHKTCIYKSFPYTDIHLQKILTGRNIGFNKTQTWVSHTDQKMVSELYNIYTCNMCIFKNSTKSIHHPHLKILKSASKSFSKK